jgi:hypothetical protein
VQLYLIEPKGPTTALAFYRTVESIRYIYPCLYDPTQRRIRTVDAQGRQQYHRFPVLQLALFTLELLEVVWQMPPYRRSPWSQRLLQAQQGSLFERFAR